MISTCQLPRPVVHCPGSRRAQPSDCRGEANRQRGSARLRRSPRRPIVANGGDAPAPSGGSPLSFSQAPANSLYYASGRYSTAPRKGALSIGPCSCVSRSIPARSGGECHVGIPNQTRDSSAHVQRRAICCGSRRQTAPRWVLAWLPAGHEAPRQVAARSSGRVPRRLPQRQRQLRRCCLAVATELFPRKPAAALPARR